MRIPTYAELAAAMVARGWRLHAELLRLNVIILRRMPGMPDRFDDMLVVAWRDRQGREQLWACRCTADPGLAIRRTPRRADGTAVWAESWSIDGFEVGSHKGDYGCLVSRYPIPVVRHRELDDPGHPSESVSLQIHRASAVVESTRVGGWSEGCTVVANPRDFARLMDLVCDQVIAGWPHVSVALMEWPASSKSNRRAA